MATASLEIIDVMTGLLKCLNTTGYFYLRAFLFWYWIRFHNFSQTLFDALLFIFFGLTSINFLSLLFTSFLTQKYKGGGFITPCIPRFTIALFGYCDRVRPCLGYMILKALSRNNSFILSKTKL